MSLLAAQVVVYRHACIIVSGEEGIFFPTCSVAELAEEQV